MRIAERWISCIAFTHPPSFLSNWTQIFMTKKIFRYIAQFFLSRRQPEKNVESGGRRTEKKEEEKDTIHHPLCFGVDFSQKLSIFQASSAWIVFMYFILKNFSLSSILVYA